MRFLGEKRKLLIALTVSVLLGYSASGCRRNNAPPPTSASDPIAAAAKIAEADQFYPQRADLSKVRQGITLLRQARIADDANYDAAWKLAKFNYYLGSHTTDPQERDDAFREGITLGRIAVQIHNDKPEGHFWLGANYGGDAQNSTLAGLANVEDIRNEMETVIKLDEGYEGGAAYVGLGELYLEAPRALGGDTQKAIDYLQKGLRVGNDNAVIMLNLAKAYHAQKRDDEARKQINHILTMTPNPNYLPEYADTVEKAKQLRDEMAQK